MKKNSSISNTTIINGMQIPCLSSMSNIQENGYYSDGITIDANNSICNAIDSHKRRTRILAERSSTKLASMPKNYPIITDNEYKSALRIGDIDNSGKAFLSQIDESVDLSFKNGLAYFFNVAASETSFVDWNTSEHIELIDTSLLSCLFGLFYLNLSKVIQGLDPDEIKNRIETFYLDIYIPDLLRYRGINSSYNSMQVKCIIDKLRQFHNTVGVIKNSYGNQMYNDGYLVINIAQVKESSNTIRISSPYISMLLWLLYKKSISNSVPKKPYERRSKVISFQDKQLAKQRDKRALEIVAVIVGVVERTGSKGIPHIKASTIINQCPSLSYALRTYNTTSDKNKLLKRSFTNAWKYLKSYTDLEEKHNVTIPDVIEVPTIRNLDILFEFRAKQK